jgi:hypothetical protein
MALIKYINTKVNTELHKGFCHGFHELTLIDFIRVNLCNPWLPFFLRVPRENYFLSLLT